MRTASFKASGWVALLRRCTRRMHAPNRTVYAWLPPSHAPHAAARRAAAPNNGSYIFITFCALSVAVAALILNLLSNLLMLWNLHNAPGSNVQVGGLLGSAHRSSVLGNPCCCDSREIANGDWGAGLGIQGRPSVQQHSTCIALGRQESWMQQLTGTRRILSWAAHPSAAAPFRFPGCQLPACSYPPSCFPLIFSHQSRLVLYGVDVTSSRFFRDEMVLKAVEFAAEAHKGQWRKTGEPYVSHCIETALIVEHNIPPTVQYERCAKFIACLLCPNTLSRLRT